MHRENPLHICLLVIEFGISHAGSLKDKRRVVKSIKDRLGGRFNVAIAEISAHDEWQRAVLGVITLGNDQRHVDQSIAAVGKFMEEVRDIELMDLHRQWL